MNIIIPLAGSGSRFIKAGYKVPKFLLKVKNKTIIELIVNNFSQKDFFYFICRESHLKDKKLNLFGFLSKIAKNCKIITVNDHKKGPVYTILSARKYFDNNKEVIINYCDFDWRWNYESFKKWLILYKPDSSLTVYRGFHPHYFTDTNYAYVKNDQFKLLQIQEKKPYTNYREEEPAAAGTFYFKKSNEMLISLKKMLKANDNLNGEFYVSISYNYFKSSHNCLLYYIDHFMQLGTPSDYEDYLIYNSYITKKFKKNTFNKFKLLLTMAGKGTRLKLVRSKKKPYININKKPMFIELNNNLSNIKNFTLLVSGDNEDRIEITNNNIKNYYFVGNTKNTFETTFNYLFKSKRTNKPVFITPCDAKIDIDEKKFMDFLKKNSDYSVVVIVYKGYPLAKYFPSEYGWVSSENNKLIQVGIKNNFSNNTYDYSSIITGHFLFKDSDIFLNHEKAFKSFINKRKIEGSIDIFVSYLLKINYNILIYEADNFYSLGTYNELRLYDYWKNANKIKKI